jgi:hypothetical protein
MPFDPNLPANNSQVRSAELRSQFTGLKSLIDAVPSGPPGPVGPQGPQGVQGVAGPAGAQGIQGLPGVAGAPGAQGPKGDQGEQGTQGDAGPEGRHVTNVSDNGSGQAIIEMSDATTYGPFTVASGPPGADGAPGPQGDAGPQGPEGPQGPQGDPGGPPGPQGPQGDVGPQGDAGPAGEPGPEGRHVTNVYDSGDGRAIIEMSDASTYGPFTVASGPAGADGAQGPPGMDGAQGPPGEVSAQQLSDAIAGTPANVNAIEPMNLTVSDPPTQSEMQTIANKLDELINALKRW